MAVDVSDDSNGYFVAESLLRDKKDGGSNVADVLSSVPDLLSSVADVKWRLK